MAILKVPEVIHSICNMNANDMPDMNALTPWALGLYTYQANPLYPFYNYYKTAKINVNIASIAIGY